MEPKIYVSIYPDDKNTCRGHIFDDVEVDFSNIPTCPECGEVVGRGRFIPPIRYKIDRPYTGDFLYVFGGKVHFLISERVKNEIQKAGLTGIESILPAEVYYRKKKIEQNYYYIEKLRRLPVTIDHRNSRIYYGAVSSKKKCPLCNPLQLITYDYLSIHFNTSEYDGTDIFKIFEMGDAVFFSQRFVDFCAEHKFNNFSYLESHSYKEENARRLFGSDRLDELMKKYNPF